MKNRSLQFVVCAALAAAAGTASAMPTVIYSEVASSPTSMVPGLGGLLFESFDRPYASADGSSWIISAIADTDTATDEFIIVGSGNSGAVVVQEGVTVMPDGSLAGPIERNMGVNNSGDYAFATNTNGDTASDEAVVKWNAGSNAFEFAKQEGQPVPGVANEVFGATTNAAGITNAGDAFFRTTASVGDLPSDDDDFLFHGTNIVAQSNVTTPGNQAGGATEPWDNFDTNDFYVSADGQNYLAQGDLQGDTGTDDVVVVNDNVALQEGSPINAGGKNIGAFTESLMNPGGAWFARGDYDDDQDWLVRNGDVIAETGDPVPGGLPGETLSDAVFSSTFFAMTGNGVGDFVYGATTSNPDTEADAVLVVNNSFVLLRQGDAVDLDGNGILDDGVLIDIFNNDDMFLTDDGTLYFTAELVEVTGAPLGQAFISVQIPAPGAGLALGLMGLAGLRRRRA